MTQKLYIRTFGCQMNEYDSDKMADVLDAADGLARTDRPEDADVILFNTCSVREKAQERVFHDLGRVRELKRRPARPHHRRRRLRGEPGGRGDRAPRALRRRRVRPADAAPAAGADRRAPRAPAVPQVDISFPEIEKFDHLPPPRVEGASAFVSIMEGCSKYCSFCVVPYTRGEEVSRPFDDVLTEVADLADQGVSEVTLLGPERQRLPRRRRAATASVADFALLLDYVAEIPGIERIRYTTSHPREMSAAPDRRLRPASTSWSRTCTCRCSRAPTACSRR